jgi:hypothetical protein
MTMNRRETLKLLAAASLGSAIPGCSPADVDRASERVAQAAAKDPLENRKPTMLNEHEYRTVHVLADYIIPADDRSGSASDAGVPAFIDFMLEDSENLRTPITGGLAWLDHYCTSRFGSTFVDCTGPEQTEILNAIAWPESADPSVHAGVRFFSAFRDLTASGFWSSKMGVDDLGYPGNIALASWEGCPEPALNHLGVAYDS